MKNVIGTVLYVGKAKNLRKRVSSYWRAREAKTIQLVSEVADIEYIVTDTEVEALILEAQLIQKYHPKYNIDLQSSGSYAFIKRTDEEYPRFIIARKVMKDGAYLGPFPSAAARNAALRTIQGIFRLCTAKRGKKRPCMRYHLGQCSGACIRAISPQEYGEQVRAAEKFLKGDFADVIVQARENMNTCAQSQEYEKARIYRDQLHALEKIESQNVSEPKQYDQDVAYFHVQDHTMLVQIFHFHRGIISGRREYTLPLDEFLAETPLETFQEFFHRYYSGTRVPHEIVVQEQLPDAAVFEKYLQQASGHRVSIIVPQRGTKKKLLDMVRKNVLLEFGEHGGQLAELQHVLHLTSLPKVIDCVDISTLSGTNTVGSLVHFVNGQSVKSGYRKFIIKGVSGINDFASVKEVVTRFGKRVKDGSEQCPDLLVIDGGRGQLNSARAALQNIELAIPTIGLAKRLEEIYVSWAPQPLHLHPKSSALTLLRAIRDEAHRFAITFQKKKRQSTGFSNEKTGRGQLL